jgi:hypothetical protein
MVPKLTPVVDVIVDHPTAPEKWEQYPIFVSVLMTVPSRDPIYTANPKAGYLAYKAEIHTQPAYARRLKTHSLNQYRNDFSPDFVASYLSGADWTAAKRHSLRRM